MIDLATPIDTLSLFNFSHLFNIGKFRPVSFNNIHKTIICYTVFLDCDFFEYPKCSKETMIIHSYHSHFYTQKLSNILLLLPL